MRLHEIANTLKAPAIVRHPLCGIYFLLPDCTILNLNWTRLSIEEKRKIPYNSEWSIILALNLRDYASEKYDEL